MDIKKKEKKKRLENRHEEALGVKFQDLGKFNRC